MDPISILGTLGKIFAAGALGYLGQAKQGFDETGGSGCEANLWSAVLTGAYLTGADLTRATLEDANLSGAFYDSATRWPKNFDPEAAGARRFE